MKTLSVSSRWVRTISMLGASVLLAVGLVATGVHVGPSDDRAEALSGASFDPGNIISDANFYDRWAMSEAQIQAFLEAKVGRCTNSNCLAVLRTSTTSRATTPMCDAYPGAANELTSTILYKVQVVCGISAKVLLVTLQKEQALVNNPAPSAARVDRAMGFGCPDNTAIPGYCDPAYGGLYNQVYLAAAQFKRYGNPPGTSNFFTWFPVNGVANVQWHPNAACGASPVRIKNKATAALYYYTPYQPNAAALNNLGGTGDGCSSYGNRNFWVFFSNWFGSPILPAGTPEGEVKEIWGTMNSINLWGWAVDLDVRTKPIQIHVLVDDSRWSVLTAGADNSTAETLYPGSGRQHGFGGSISIAGGTHKVCVYGVNQGSGVNLPMGCWNVVVPDGSPVGALDSIAAGPKSMLLAGWAVDRDALAATVPIHLTVDGRWYVMSAGAPNGAGEAALPGAGQNHGFSGEITAGPGPHNVCVYAVNTGGGSNLTLGCRTVVIPSGSPIGRIGDVWGTPNQIYLWGWALDPDTADSIQVHVSVDGAWTVFAANATNSSVGSAYPLYGAAHGFGGTIKATPGAHQVCSFAVNVSTGTNTTLDCRTVTVPGGSPIGRLGDVAGGAGVVSLWGWALDPDTSGAIAIHVLVDSTWFVLRADAPNAAVGAAYPAYGPNHGFGSTIPLPGGTHNICVYAVNEGSGSNTTLSCSVVQVV